MSNTAFEESPQGAARALVEHLRQNPGETRDPAALAARFGLETEFVRRALARLSESGRVEATRGPSRIAHHAGGALTWADDALERAASRPLRFVALSLLAVGGLVVALSLLFPAAPHTGEGLRASVRGGFSLASLLLTVGVQLAVFYRRRMARYALYGGLVFSGLTALGAMVMTWADLQRHPQIATTTELRQGVLVFLSGLAMLLVGTLYTALAVFASLAGGWVRLRREDWEWERLSRQELLERYFELGRRLDRSVASPEEPQTWEAFPPIAWVSARPFLSAALVGFATGSIDALILAGFGNGGDPTETLQLLAIANGACAITLFTGVAFLAGKASRGVLCAPAYVGAAFVASTLLSRGILPVSGLSDPLRLASVAFSLCLYALVGALAGVGATVQRRAVRDARLQRDDGATLVAEMLEIQWRLEEDAMHVTVLVVDAAKSTAMKVGADPLDVEYSFREYQMWIAEVCANFGGRIHSVAGDGAVVAFPDNAAAMAAARRLQTDVPRFNTALNRLPKPFRLRLGLHAGRVAGDLNDVQFTEVIDIAAHVETIAPVGGIAATGTAVEGLGEEGFLPLAREVDGQPVYIALVPTEG